MNIRSLLPNGNWHILETRVPPIPRESCDNDQLEILDKMRANRNSDQDLNVFMYLIGLGPVFKNYYHFFRTLLFKGGINRADKERIVLRVAWRTGAVYEWFHHLKLGRDVAISTAEATTFAQEESSDWSSRTEALVKGADELVANKAMSAPTLAELRKHLSDAQVVEFCMLVGHYVMVAMMINTVGVQVEPEYLAIDR